MKTKTQFRKITSLSLLLFLMVIVIASCRKSDTDYIPVPPPPSGQVATDAFPNWRPVMMSKYEITHRVIFPGHIIHLAGKGLGAEESSGTWETFKELCEVVEKIHDYKDNKHKENEFKEIQDALVSLREQDSAMNSTNVAMLTDLGIQIDDLTTILFNSTLQPWISNVNTAMGTANHNQLGYFVNTAAQWEADSLNSTNITLMDNLSTYAPTYADDVYNSTDQTGMIQTLQNLHDIICTPLDPGSSIPANPLKAYAKTLVDNLKVNSVSRVLDSEEALNLYIMLETYFLTIINYEFQAATVYSNAAKMMDPTGVNKYDSIFLASFAGQIFDQVNIFLPVVDYLVVNASEYRDQARFERDIKYEDQGLAPDTVFGAALARSQFVANLLCAAVGKSYPVMCGYILTPQYYGSSPSGAINLTIGSRSLTTTPIQVQSQLPYTKWANGTCSSDYNWTINRLGTLGAADPGWTTTKQTITIPAAGWSPVTVPTGSVTPLYYNPKNLNESSPTQDSVHSMLFAYFAANWMWGQMYIDNSYTRTAASGDGDFDFKPFNSNMGAGNGNQFNTPLEAYGKDGLLQCNLEGVFTESSRVRILGWSGKMAQTKDYYVIADGHCTPVQTDANVPPGGNVQAWCYYNVKYTMQGSGTTFLTVNIGTSNPGRKYTGIWWYYVGSELTTTKWQSKVNVLNSEFKYKQLATGTKYNCGIQYYYEAQNVPANSAPGTILLNTSYQIVYAGYYSVPL